MSDQECEIELNLDGFIDRDGLDDYISLYLKHILIYGFTSSTWAYLDIRTEEEFSVDIVGMKIKANSFRPEFLELNIDLTSDFLPHREKILEAKKNNVNIFPSMKGTLSYGEYGSSVGALELIVEEIDAKVVIGEDSDIDKYYQDYIESRMRDDDEGRHDGF